MDKVALFRSSPTDSGLIANGKAFFREETPSGIREISCSSPQKGILPSPEFWFVNTGTGVIANVRIPRGYCAGMTKNEFVDKFGGIMGMKIDASSPSLRSNYVAKAIKSVVTFESYYQQYFPTPIAHKVAELTGQRIGSFRGDWVDSKGNVRLGFVRLGFIEANEKRIVSFPLCGDQNGLDKLVGALLLCSPREFISLLGEEKQKDFVPEER